MRQRCVCLDRSAPAKQLPPGWKLGLWPPSKRRPPQWWLRQKQSLALPALPQVDALRFIHEVEQLQHNVLVGNLHVKVLELFGQQPVLWRR